jgi:diaminopimelate decarboxylase
MLSLSPQQLNTIANEFGTPLYVYHAEHITAQYQKLTNAFAKTDTKIFYACKALTNIHILKHIKSISEAS